MAILQGLVSNNGNLYAMWKGVPGDERIFYSIWNGTGPWSPQAVMAGVTSTGPSMTVFNGAVFAAWKGEWSDPRLFYASLGANPIWSPLELIPGATSGVGPALGVINGKMVAAWMNPANQSIVYAVFDGRIWSPEGVIPGVATSVGPSLALYNGKLYAAWKGAGADQGLYYSSFDGSHWSAQAQIPGVASSVGPSLAGVGNSLYAVWKGENTDQGLYWSSFNGSSWSAQAQIPGAASSEGAAISNYNGVLYAMWKGAGSDDRLWMSHLTGTTWAAQSQPLVGSTGQDVGLVEPTAPAPGGGLGSFSNYFLADNCNKILGLKIEVQVTQDLVAADPTAGNQPGFAFQLNAQSPVDAANPNNPNWIVWQQYIVGVGGTNVGPGVNNWTVAALSAGQQTIDGPGGKHIATLAHANTIPAGSTVTIELTNDNLGNVTGVSFNLQPGGNLVNIPLIGLPLRGGGNATTANMAPIIAFELNLVGPGDGKHTHFTSGAGTIIYSSTNFLSALATLPSCVANQSTTGETSNSVYGPLFVAPNNFAVQSFSVNPKLP